jgi:hypothetical protein
MVMRELLIVPFMRYARRAVNWASIRTCLDQVGTSVIESWR